MARKRDFNKACDRMIAACNRIEQAINQYQAGTAAVKPKIRLIRGGKR